MQFLQPVLPRGPECCLHMIATRLHSRQDDTYWRRCSLSLCLESNSSRRFCNICRPASRAAAMRASALAWASAFLAAVSACFLDLTSSLAMSLLIMSDFFLSTSACWSRRILSVSSRACSAFCILSCSLHMVCPGENRAMSATALIHDQEFGWCCRSFGRVPGNLTCSCWIFPQT